jgi:hypothetical protein
LALTSDHLFFHDVDEMAIVKVADVIAVLGSGMAAARSVLMRMVGMDVVCHDRFLSL